MKPVKQGITGNITNFITGIFDDFQRFTRNYCGIQQSIDVIVGVKGKAVGGAIALGSVLLDVEVAENTGKATTVESVSGLADAKSPITQNDHA